MILLLFCAPSPLWVNKALGGGFYRIANRNGGKVLNVARHSGKVLNVQGASTADGAEINQWSWANVDQQKFQLVKVQ